VVSAFTGGSWNEGDLGRGYLEEHFAAHCKTPGCGLLVTKDTLAAKKLAGDLVRNDGTARSCLA
jgi:hypothetical protein